MRELTKEQVLKIMDYYGNDPQQLIAVLLDIQEASGNNCVEKQWAELAADVLKVSLSKIYDVLTFYTMFGTEPRGEFIIKICSSTPCYFNRTLEIVKWFEDAAGIKMGETSTDGKFTLMFTNCVGACDIGPVAMIGNDVFGNLTQEKVKTLVKLFREKNGQTNANEELENLCQN
jgi:NADH-quinone oxidoreductase subunit E